MIKQSIFWLLLLPLAVTKSYAASTALVAHVPPLQLGHTWTVSLRQYDVTAINESLSPAQLLNYRVVAPAIVDNQAAWKISVTSETANKTPFIAYIGHTNRQLLRVEYKGRVVDYASIDGETHGAVLSEIGYIPFDMPSFSQQTTSAKHRFVSVLTDWGFPVSVTQHQIESQGNIEVSLSTPSKRIKQQWRKNSPWWHSSEQVGVYQATLVKAPTIAKLHRVAIPKVIYSNIKRTANWSYPKSVDLKGVNKAASNGVSALLENPLSSQADKQIWSGSWWATSAYHGTVNKLTRTWAKGGLLEKYDDYALQMGGRTGAQNWETNHANSFFMEAWHGHCNGWAAASIIFDEPTHAKTVDGIHFSVADQKGLLTELAYGVGIDYYLGPTYRKSSDNPLEPAPYDVHRAIVENMGIHKRAMIADLDNNRQLWNYPFYRYQMTESPANDNRVRISLKLWYAAATPNNPNFIGLTDRTITYRYYLSTDDNGNVTDGPSEWIANSDPHKTNPDYLWIPSEDAPSGSRRSHNPYLNADLIEQIVNNPFSSEIAVSSNPTTGEISDEGQAVWYHFDVTEAGDFIIETELLTLKDSRLYLYSDPDAPAIAENDDITSGNLASRITHTLATGRYYIKVRAYSSRQTGDYKLTVDKG